MRFGKPYPLYLVRCFNHFFELLEAVLKRREVRKQISILANRPLMSGSKCSLKINLISSQRFQTSSHFNKSKCITFLSDSIVDLVQLLKYSLAIKLNELFETTANVGVTLKKGSKLIVKPGTEHQIFPHRRRLRIGFVQSVHEYGML